MQVDSLKKEAAFSLHKQDSLPSSMAYEQTKKQQNNKIIKKVN